jgi:hypothetical protein
LIEKYLTGYRLEVSPYPMIATGIEIIEAVTGIVGNPLNVRFTL